MIQRIRNSFYTKVVAVFVTMNMVGEIIFPALAYSQTSGPVCIDQASFEPASTSEMVDLSTGNFTYNIPLLDVDGYPINIAYHGGVGMEQEASMVGLGWSLNVGALNRTKRGLPDDFNGDEITTTMNLRPNYSTGGRIGVSTELFGFDNGIFNVGLTGSVGVGVSFNNYTGFASEVFAGLAAHAGVMNVNGQYGIQMGSDSQNGMTISDNASIGIGIKNTNISIGVGHSYNSMEGLQSKSITAGISVTSRSGLSLGLSSTRVIPLSTVSYTPSISFEQNTNSRNFDYSLGGTLFGLDLQGQYKCFESVTCNENATETVPAYGYLFEEQHLNKNEYLLDYNQEGNGLANEYIANLPITNHTYDMFSATAQGVGFTFRPHRSDVGIVSQMDRQNNINGVGISAEVGFGASFQAGINVSIPSGYVRTGKWVEDNAAETDMNFRSSAPTGIDASLYENYYFKKFGNRSSTNDLFYNDLGTDEAVKQKISKSGVTHNGEIKFIDKNDNIEFNSSDNDHYKTERDLRNTSIQYSRADEADLYSYQDKVDSYSLSESTGYDYTGGDYSSTPSNRYGTLSTEAKAHHLSEMTVLKGDGSRYVYGIPVINKTTSEVTFNVSDESSDGSSALTRDCQKGLVSYTAGTDNSVDNTRGATNLFLERTIPAYASSYLLSAYLSSNYIDRTGDGPTPDDYGGYTKFNYSKTGTTNWRFPYEEDKAAYNEGLKADDYDDMGSYVYGERDQWYMHSIESKNFVAEFHYGDRHDGFGVIDEDGGRASTNYTKRLIKIELYSRQGKLNGEAPIKTVHFEYDYSLCLDIPSNDDGSVAGEEGVSNNQGGKLTLKGIYFTYGSSNRGELHKYEFDYGTGTQNPSYALGENDRWGTYKKNLTGSTCDETGNLTNIEFPYAEQNQANANTYAGAWMLKTIHLPSGSDINVVVESDDYNYVQDVPAAKMFMIKGFSETSTYSASDDHILYETDLLNGDITAHNYLHVELDELGATTTAAKENFLENYLVDDQLYFRIMVRVSPLDLMDATFDVGDRYEYISGYAKVDGNSCVFTDENAGGGYETVAIKLKDVSLEDQHESPLGIVKTNPVSKASWQFTRKYLPQVINPVIGSIYDHDDEIDCEDLGDVPVYDEDDDIQQDPATESKGEFLKNIIETGQSHLQNIASLGGVNFMMSAFLYSSECVPEKSWIRLSTGGNVKLGGGHRVSKITVDDNWDDVKSGEVESTYGTQYSYQTTDENDNVISSGVASYEPITSGGDENAMRQPLSYTIDVKMRVDDEEFQELPFGETIFASPNVVYSKIEVKNIAYTNVTQNATGKTVYEYYTAKDFPVIFDQTGRASATKKKSQSNWTALFTGNNKDYLAMSQGYSIHVNDMHGKFKAKRVYGEAISSTIDPPEIYSMVHTYYTDANNDKKLNNYMSVVDESGTVSSRYLGRELDMVVNLNEVSTLYESMNFDAGVDISIIFPVAFIVPTVWYSNMSVENQFRSSTTTKVITSTGILQKIELFDKSRFKSTENLIFDKKTGVPIVTEINHEMPTSGSSYEIPIYQYDYPAYWMYDGMGLASENWGLNYNDGVELDGDQYKIKAAFKPYVNPGDELRVLNMTDITYEGKFWVIEKETTGDYYIVEASGQDPVYFNGAKTYNYRVVRSGKRNLLGSTAASVTSLNKNISTPYTSTHTSVLNASAVEYTQVAYGYASSKGNQDPKNYCGLAVGQEANPYKQGLRGNWNLYTSYVYDSGRDQTTGNIRIDGELSDYIEWWKYSSGWAKNTAPQVDEKWIQAAIATLFDREGYNLESKNALGIYSSILLGYNNTLKIAEAVNSRYYEIGYDGFEDRDYDLSSDCTSPHFRFNSGGTLTTDEAHSGRYSYKIATTGYSQHNSDLENSIDHTTTNHVVPYIIQEQELIKTHTFIVSTTDPTKYVLTAWAKEDVTGSQITNYDGADIKILIDGTPLAATNVVEKRSNIIDGWQRIEIVFSIPATTVTTEVGQIKLGNLGSNNVYYDDIRVQPFNSEMVSYVIDPISLRLWATLDSRNFATFYQYDEEGSLIRIIQETERGKVTVQENRAGIRVN